MRKIRSKYKGQPCYLIMNDDKDFEGIVIRVSVYRDEPNWQWMTGPGEYWNWGWANTMKKAIDNLVSFKRSYYWT